MKNYLIAFGILISFLSCEKDEICIDPITPHLIIRFYDATNPTVLKTVANIQIKNIDIDSIYNTNIVASDSIAIPLNVNQDSSTYVLSINSNDTALINSDTITVNYSRQAVFVSRSCGFKTVFNEATVHLTTDSDNWIKTIATVDFPENITNETKAHVKILH
jgi:hypothetical protein